MPPREYWRRIPQYPKYEVSNLGHVRHIKFKRILKAPKQTAGYPSVQFWDNLSEKRICCTVHRLVALLFLPNPRQLNEIDHKDRNKENNNKNNLRWVTRQENLKNRVWKPKAK